MSRLPGVQFESLVCEEPDGDWHWGELGDNAIRARLLVSPVTAGELVSHLLRYPASLPCLSSLWFEEDFLSLDETLTPEEIAFAMEIAEDRHDANIGLNWDSLRKRLICDVL